MLQMIEPINKIHELINDPKLIFNFYCLQKDMMT